MHACSHDTSRQFMKKKPNSDCAISRCAFKVTLFFLFFIILKEKAAPNLYWCTRIHALAHKHTHRKYLIFQRTACVEPSPPRHGKWVRRNMHMYKNKINDCNLLIMHRSFALSVSLYPFLLMEIVIKKKHNETKRYYTNFSLFPCHKCGI